MAVKGTGVAIPGLNSTQVRSLAMLVPPPEVTRAFDALVEPLTARILANGSQSRTLGELRDALLPRLMSGDIEIAA
jgi:type I restriction enzyme S subunit